MNLDRLSVTVPAELGEALRALADRRSESVSAIVAEAIEARLRTEALREALEEADRQFGRVSPELIDAATAELLQNRAKATPRASRKTRTAAPKPKTPRSRSAA